MGENKSFKGLNTEFMEWMDGKQTDSISYSLKRCVIKRVVDGKGIWIS